MAVSLVIQSHYSVICCSRERTSAIHSFSLHESRILFHSFSIEWQWKISVQQIMGFPVSCHLFLLTGHVGVFLNSLSVETCLMSRYALLACSFLCTHIHSGTELYVCAADATSLSLQANLYEPRECHSV